MAEHKGPKRVNRWPEFVGREREKSDSRRAIRHALSPEDAVDSIPETAHSLLEQMLRKFDRRRQ